MTVRMLAVLNQKGGVGKTTTCVNLGAALARRGRRVLLLDMDPQANLTVHLGIAPAGIEATTYSVLLGRHGIEEAARPTSTPGLSVVPSTLALANAEIQLASAVGRELILKEALEEWLWPSDSIGRRATDERECRADFVLMDCPPSLGILSMNALCAAREVLLPIQTHFFALQGVAGILEGLKAVRRLNRRLELGLVLPSMVDRRTTLAREVIEEIRTYFGDSVAETTIGMNVKLAEAPSHGQTIFEYAPGCTGARDYDALAEEVLGSREPVVPEAPAPPEPDPPEPDRPESEASDEIDATHPTETDETAVADEGVTVFVADSTADLTRGERPETNGHTRSASLELDGPTTTQPLDYDDPSRSRLTTPGR